MRFLSKSLGDITEGETAGSGSQADWQWLTDLSFAEVTRRAVYGCEWKVESLGAWQREEPVSFLKGRALVRAIQTAVEGHCARVLVLGDNLRVVIGLRGRGRTALLCSAVTNV